MIFCNYSSSKEVENKNLMSKALPCTYLLIFTKIFGNLHHNNIVSGYNWQCFNFFRCLIMKLFQRFLDEIIWILTLSLGVLGKSDFLFIILIFFYLIIKLISRHLQLSNETKCLLQVSKFVTLKYVHYSNPTIHLSFTATLFQEFLEP